MSAKYKSPSFLLPNELNTNTNPLNTDGNPATGTGINSLYSMDFDGTNYISIGDNIALSGNKTVSFWFRADNISGNNVVIGGNQSPTINYYPYITSTSICLRDSTGYDCLTVPAFSNNVWYHLCIVGNGTTATVYIDGQPQGTLNDKSPTINTIGAFSNAASAFYGSIDEVAIWNTELTSTQVSEIYNATDTNLTKDLTTVSGSNLIYWNRMGDN